MATRIFLVPVVVTTLNHPVTGAPFSSRAVKYRELFVGANNGGVDFGFEPVFLLVADVDATQLAALVANADVTACPANLDNTLGANRQAVENALESFNLPGNWVGSGMTYRDVIRACTGVLTFAGRISEVSSSGSNIGRLFPSGVTMTTTYGQLEEGFRDKIRQSLDALGYDRSTLSGASTMRDLLRLIGIQAPPWSCGIAPGVTVTV